MTKTFPTWKTLTLVVYPTVDALVQAIEASGSRIGMYAWEIMAKMPLAKEPIKYELVLASARDLGIIEEAHQTRIFAKASEHGLDKCPPELGPQLRRRYAGQPKNEGLVIAMDPIADANGYLHVFDVARDDGDRWLDTDGDCTDIVWLPGVVWVFIRRKQ